jgi:hypothetical protein
MQQAQSIQQHNLEPKTLTWLNYSQHKIQHAAQSKHRSSRINTTHNVSLKNNIDQPVKTKHNIWLTTHRDQAESTQNMTHSSQKIHTKQCAQDITQSS